MDFKDLMIILGVIIVGTLGMLLFMDELETNYGVSTTTATGEQKISSMLSNITYTDEHLRNFSTDTRGSIDSDSGITSSDSLTDMGWRALRVIGFLPKMIFQLIPHLIATTGDVLDLPSYVVDTAVVVFIAVIILIFAYVLLLGARRLL